MDSDERFKHLASDPRFKTLRKKQKKVTIDDRFQSMFTDKKFTLKYATDKRGKNQKKTSNDDLKRYYNIESEKNEKKQTKEKEQLAEEDEISDEETVQSDNSDNEEDATVGGQDSTEDESSAGESESEVSSSSDESDSEVEDPGASEDELDLTKLNYNWQPLDHDAETADTTTRRLAIQNLDWDNLDIKDIYTLVNSIRPPLNVRIYVSEFGKERLAKEEVHGPQEIIEMPKDDEVEQEYNELKVKMRLLKNLTPKVNEYVDADEEMDPKNEEIRERIRRYQLNRMKYFYAVAEFDSSESAEAVYKELDGMEYEGSSLELDLRFVPDDMQFDEADMKAECNKAPDLATYKAPQFISSALQQTTVRFTWDETDIKRQDKLRRAYTKEELERDDLEAYLASETDTESDNEDIEDENEAGDTISVVTGNSEARALKYKNLLRNLEEEEQKKKNVDVDVEWGNYSEDEEKLAAGEVNDKDDDRTSGSDMSEDLGVDHDEDDDEEDTELEPKFVAKGKKTKQTKQSKGNKRHKSDKDQELDEGLDLLVMDVDNKKEDFQFNPEDQRFQAVYESSAYNIDPSHPNFKRTDAFNMMAERKRERRYKRTNK